MSEETALVVRQSLTPQMWDMIRAVAPAMHASQLFGVRSPEQAMAIMLKGHELGLSLSASFEFIHVIEGKPGLNPRGALALIQSHPDFAGMRIEDLADDEGEPVACRVWMKRRNGTEYIAQYTIADAKRAGLIKPRSGWEKYPANMLRWRAVGFCADVVFPDVMGGMKRTDELGADLTPDGDTSIVEGEWSVSTPPLPPQRPSGNGGKVERPMQPALVKKAVTLKARKYDGPDEISDDDTRATVICLSKLVLGDDEKRYALTEFLTSDDDGANGVHSTKFLAPAQAWAIRQWAGATKDNDWQPNEYSVVEASTILTYLETLGQQELPLEKEESEQ